MTSTAIDRRALLEMLAVLSVGSTWAGLLAAQNDSAPVLRGLAPVEEDAIRDLAKAYAAFDESDSPGIDQMVERLRVADLRDDSLVEALRREMLDDFGSGRTTSLYGWRVSRTEARVLAAAARLLP